MKKERLTKDDGRYIIFYEIEDEPDAGENVPPEQEEDSQ